MKIHTLLLSLLVIFPTSFLLSQASIPNGSFDTWTGVDTVRPDGWVTTEQMQNLRVNKWVIQETRPEFVRTGNSAIRLTCDTMTGKAMVNNEAYGTYVHKTGVKKDGKTGATIPIVEDYSYMPGVIAAGRPFQSRGYNVGSGVALNGRPSTFSFYARLNHPVADTASMRLLLTRWNPSRGTQDTVAIERRDIFPDSTVMMGYALFTDTINYLLLGDADTARITFYGGRMRNVAARGNVTWLDGVTFGYGLPTAPRSSALADSLWITPNPIINRMNVKTDISLQGFKLVIQAETSVIVKEVVLSQLSMDVDMTDLPVGNYAYALVDREQRSIRKGYISVIRN